MESVRKGETLIPTPRWFIALRAAQIVIALIILALTAFLIHGFYADPEGIAVASAIFTWIIAAYAILTEHSAACRSGYNTWAILSLDFFMMVLWLATLGANAAFRASFVVPVEAECYDDGSAVNANHCNIYGRGLEKRAAVAGSVGRAIISAVAGISAIELLLFVATFAYVAHFFRLEWAKHSGSDVEKASNVAAAAPVPDQQQPQWAQQQHQPAAYPTQTAPYDPYNPAPQNTGYAGAQGVYDQPVQYQTPQDISGQPVQNQPPQYISPQATPAPGQPYYPPQ